MKQFVVDRFPDEETGQLKLGKKDRHYLIDVRRLGPGDKIDLLLPQNIEAVAEIVSHGPQEVVLAITSSFVGSQPDGPQVHLALALLKGQKLDQVIRQATEIGVATVSLFESDHCIAKLSENSKAERWNTIIREAAQQSGAKFLPKLELCKNPSEFIKKFTSAYSNCQLVFCHEKHIADSSVHEYCSHDSEHYGILIGPEGGFSNNEVEIFMSLGGQPLYLGQQVLRAETAAIYGLSVFKSLLLERKSWQLKQNS